MVGTTAYIAFGLMIAAGLILPTVLCIWWLKTRHEKFTSVLTGAMTFLIFALVLESIVHSIVFMVFPGIKDNVVAYMLYGALMAGIFEETGRFLAYKLVLKKRTNRETAISYEGLRRDVPYRTVDPRVLCGKERKDLDVFPRGYTARTSRCTGSTLSAGSHWYSCDGGLPCPVQHSDICDHVCILI